MVEESFNDTKRSSFTGQDLRFTKKGEAIYAIALAWPQKTLTIKSLGASSPYIQGKVKEVALLGHSGRLQWKQDQSKLTIGMPDRPPCNFAYVLKITGLSNAK